MNRLARGVLIGLAASLVLPAPAFAHGGTDHAGYSNFRTTVTAISPAVPGLRVEIADVDGGIRLTYSGAEPLFVLGYDGEPYLRLGPDGVFANLNSPATYVNLRTDANVPVPDTATTGAAPNWHQLTADHSYLWHDHRIHWMGSVPPDIVQAAPDSPHVVNPEWTIPLSLGSTESAVTGQLLWVPPPNRTLWLAAAMVIFIATVLLLQMSAWWRPVALAALGAGLAANLVVAIGRVGVAESGFGKAAAAFALAAVIAAGAGLTLWRVRRGAVSIPRWSALSGTAMLVGGVAYLPMLNFSQLHSTMTAPLNRVAVIVELAAGAALVAAVLIDRFVPAGTQDSVAAADA